MDKAQFKSLIRETINEELKSVLPEVLSEYFRSMKPQRPVATAPPAAVQQRRPAAPAPQRPPAARPPAAVRPKAPVQPARPAAPKKYATDPLLNQILSETKGGVPQEGSFYTPMSPTFEKVGSGLPQVPIQRPVAEQYEPSYDNVNVEGVDDYIPPTSMQAAMLNEAVEEPVPTPAADAMSSLLSRNFSQILKKSKQGGIGGGQPRVFLDNSEG